jgi:hypothetical protein
MRAILDLISDNSGEFIIFCVILFSAIAGCVAIYYDHQTTKAAMENGYIQKVENHRTIWVKENAN